MNLPRIQNFGDVTEYVNSHKFVKHIILSLILLFLLICLDASKYREALDSQVETFAVAMQKSWIANYLKFFSLIVSYIGFFGMFAYILFIFLFDTNSEASFMLLFYTLVFMYSQTVLKLIYHEKRPFMRNNNMWDDWTHGLCDYGKPSGHTLCTSGILLMLYYDSIRYFKLQRCSSTVLALILQFIAFCVGFSRLLLGAHSFSQIILGYAFGSFIYYVIASIESKVQKGIIWPLIYKDRFRSRNAISNLLYVFYITNTFMLFLWARNYLTVDLTLKKLSTARSWNYCIQNRKFYFSTKIVKECMIINVFYGMFIGIAIRDFKIFKFKGFFYDKSVWKFCLRTAIFLLFLYPISILVLPLHELEIFKYYLKGKQFILLSMSMTLCLTVGYGLMKWCLDLLIWMNLLDEVCEQKVSENTEMEQSMSKFKSSVLITSSTDTDLRDTKLSNLHNTL